MSPEDRNRLRHMIDAARTAQRFLLGRQRSDLDTDAFAAATHAAHLDISREETRIARAGLEVRTAQLAATEGQAAQREATLRQALDAKEAERAAWEARAAQLDGVAGSLRLFLRSYLPRLRQHFFGR